jgi:hypothetical protein
MAVCSLHRRKHATPSVGGDLIERKALQRLQALKLATSQNASASEHPLAFESLFRDPSN